MNGLLARLRARADGRELNAPLFDADMREAADEIERLRAALAGLIPTALHYGGLRDCDAAAIKAARIALGETADAE